jgi:competence protein ComEC
MPRPAWLAIGASVGAVALDLAPSPVVLILCATSGLAISVALQASRRTRPARRSAALALGMLAIAIRVATAPAPPAVGVAPDGDGPWLGVVQSVSAPRAGARPALVQLETKPSVLVAATLPWYPPVVPGDRIELRGRIRPPPPADDYGAYLERIGAVGTLRAESLSLAEANGADAGSLASWLEALRRSASDGLSRAMPEPEAGLAAGVLIGLRDRVDRDLAADFTTAGASHVVAISGWNIAIVASTLAAIAGGMRRRRRALLTAAAIVVYVAFVGPSPSVVRAGVMAGVALLAREVGRPGTAAGALGWAVAALLMLDPGYIDDAGFRLSVLATAGILAWGSSLTARLSGPEPGRPRRWLAEILGVSLAAQAATTPVVLLDFGRLSLVAPLVNLIVVPLVPAAMAAGAVALGVGMLVAIGVPSVVATLVGLPAWVLYAAMVATVRAGASLPMASLQLEPRWDVVGAAIAACAIAALARWGPGLLRRLAERRRRSRASAAKPRGRRAAQRSATTVRAAAIAVAGATVALALAIAHRPDGLVRVVVFDVGQGDGILVEGGRGGRLVIDGGPDPGRLLVELDERLPPWDRRIDMLVLTHPHEDHVAGLATLLSRYRVGRVYEPGMLGPGPGYRAWSAALAGGGTPRGRLSTGDRLQLDDVRFRVLWPDPDRVPERPPDGGTAINNVSIVLLGEFDGHRVLLAGDIEEGIDPDLVRRGLPQVDLLKVAHHGSRTSSTPAFLDAVHPRVAVVSSGVGNPYGHPAPATIDRLHAFARATYRTDTDGTVEVSFDGPSIRVRTTGPRRAAVEAAPADVASPASADAAKVAAARARAPAQASTASAYLCGIAGQGGALAAAPPPWRARVREAPVPARAIAGPITARSAGVGGLVALPRLPEPVIGAALALGYHRPDADAPGAGDRAAPRNGSPRLLLGRRRLLAGRRGRGLPLGSRALPRRRSRALAAGGRANRTRPPPG